jgi:hypothetical protein
MRGAVDGQVGAPRGSTGGAGRSCSRSIRAAYGLGSGLGFGTLTGIVTGCPPAEIAANGGDSDPSYVETVYVQNQAGLTVASQLLSLRTSEARYRMRLLAGIYTIGVYSGANDDSADNLMSNDTVTVPADETTEEDFDESDGCG